VLGINRRGESGNRRAGAAIQGQEEGSRTHNHHNHHRKRMTSKKGRYVLHPGWVTSVNDGDRHYISADKLMSLYGLDWNQRRRSVVYGKWRWASAPALEGDVHLHPSPDGMYSLPEEDCEDL
jgi:hypothetical protein